MSMEMANGRPTPDDRPGWYYVTIVAGDRHGLLAGPFRNNHPRAVAMVEWVRRLAREVSPRQAAFAGFGTAWSEVDQGPGILHDGHQWTPKARDSARGNVLAEGVLAEYDAHHAGTAT
jgi:hypothetical protein